MCTNIIYIQVCLLYIQEFQLDAKNQTFKNVGHANLKSTWLENGVEEARLSVWKSSKQLTGPTISTALRKSSSIREYYGQPYIGIGIKKKNERMQVNCIEGY